METKMPEFTVTPEEAGLTIEAWLQKRIPAAPTGYLHQLTKKGRVTNKQDKLGTSNLVNAGDTILLPDSTRLLELMGASTSEKGVEILFETREFLIVNKPAGLAIHSSQGHEQDNLTDRIKAMQTARHEQFQIAPIQRLDLETSGPVLFGKGRKSCSELGKLFMSGATGKTYLALADGQLTSSATLESVIPSKGKEKAAETRYRALESNSKATLLELELVTGRQHQIRRQLAEIGHPLYGDKRYLGPCPRELGRLFLHCRRLTFKDPFNNQAVDITAALPEELMNFLSGLGLKAGQ
jgi:RluA family pseudouridine synthase